MGKSGVSKSMEVLAWVTAIGYIWAILITFMFVTAQKKLETPSAVS